MLLTNPFPSIRQLRANWYQMQPSGPTYGAVPDRVLVGGVVYPETSLLLGQPTPRIAFVSSGMPDADDAAARLRARYGSHALESADVVVALGGDGLMLQTLHEAMQHELPVYGMNFGSVGFLMNAFSEDDLVARLSRVQRTRIYPLSMNVTDSSGQHHVALALNEVSVFRSTYQAAKIQILVDGETRLEELVCDGVLIATPAGSTAYNLSAHGPILPIEAQLLALTPISPFRPRRWRGAILTNRAEVKFVVREAVKRPVNAVADNVEFKDVLEVSVREDRSHGVTLLFDPGSSLEERVLSEQFRF
jgi:NAD+ kinase